MPGSDLRLLALDGGGVRGLSALMILEQLMEAVNPDAPPKPCDYFDMIGGTSTGGLIAIMLGRLKMSVADCITAYLSLSDRVFRKTRHRVTVKGQIQGRFDAEELARAIKEVVKQQGLQEDALLKDEPTSTCKVFVCATSKETSETVCLTSYRTPRGIHNVTIWEACRATSAATSFFDPIAIGRFGEQFVDGAIGANNPVRELWDQAQLAWGPEPLDGKVKCLVSIGTGVPSLKAFKDDVFHIGETLAAIATETEQTAERFRRERGLLDSTGRYYRFNVVRGLEDIGLEEAKKVKEMAAATRRYVSSQEVHKQVQACAGNIASREYFGEYRTVFSLEGVPRAREFVDRLAEMTELERVLLPRLEQRQRQKIHVLRGLGGIGKTQLAVEFARRHHRRFSSVFWLDGRSEDILKRSIASCAGRIPQGQIPETSREYAADSSADIDVVVKDVMAWLARPNNAAWLLIFDNVDREYTAQGGDPDAYDMKRYLSGADHGSVLVTTRLARLEQLGESQQLGKVSKEQGKAILKSWYKNEYDAAENEQLLALLDGLPLAIAHAGAYLQESGVGLATYLRFYEQQWSELMASDLADVPLQDYPERSVWTTWAISYQAIRDKHEATANLLLLWSFLDNKDLWYGLFAAASSKSAIVAKMLLGWVGDIASSELKFSRAMQLLRSYSLVEVAAETTGTTSYATHPVVHQWAHHSRGKYFAAELSRLATAAVGWAVPESSSRNYAALQRRLLPHAQTCFSQIARSEAVWYRRAEGGSDGDVNEGKERKTILYAIHLLGDLYADQGKLGEAEQMYQRALRGYEEALGPSHTHTSTLDTVNNLGNLYADQGKLGEAEQMYQRALRGREEALGPSHTSTLDTVNNLGALYADQGKLGEAEQMYQRALRGREEALGPSHTSTLAMVNNLGLLYADQGRLGEAEQMYQRALRGKEEALGPTHTSTLDTVNNLGNLYADQGKLGEAEQMYQRALRGREEALGPTHTSTLDTVNNLGALYADQGKLGEAEQMYQRALRGYEEALGSVRVQQYLPALNTLENTGDLYAKQAEVTKARAVYSKALAGFTSVLGQWSERCMRLAAKMEALPSPRRERRTAETLIVGESSTQQHDKIKKSSRLSIRRLIKKAL
ncbi:hypothetical protein COCHEDRAFT_1167485 [Bipolaris maydis C5]|uniref:PNPLA domain-containing protein n=2 Tax=Cochliobolus heterostrophus TaxID=5016 RepID=M2TG30_COCH5|nr:hypothetical protein COCHEDRAFT_1167485 [Bipolaris maydis C5]KAJ6203508.1 hypothetical protein PSV09DRAFT_1167485 [Bipolaris maydis]KAJ6274145.1 hypothetical protein PSV08DRAFT_406966 [Bipolaris maydis]